MPNGIFGQKSIKQKSENRHRILHIRNSLGTKIRLNLPKKGNYDLKKNHHRILHIPFSLGSKFQLQQTILIFGENFFKKEYFCSGRKQKKMNITTEFFIFELI